MRLLVLVDVQNVYYGAKNYMPGRSIDYVKLKDYIVKWIKKDDFDLCTVDPTFTAYVVQTPAYRGMAFFAFLKKAGYALRTRVCGPKEETDYEPGSVSSMLQLDAINQASYYDALVVVSGSGVYEPAFRAIRQNWSVRCGIAAFDNTLHRIYSEGIPRTDAAGVVTHEKVVDFLIPLGEEVLA